MVFLASVILWSSVWGRAVVCHMPQQMTPPSHCEARLHTDACMQTYTPSQKCTHLYTHIQTNHNIARDGLQGGIFVREQNVHSSK